MSFHPPHHSGEIVPILLFHHLNLSGIRRRKNLNNEAVAELALLVRETSEMTCHLKK